MTRRALFLSLLLVLAAHPAGAAALCPESPAAPVVRVQVSESPIDFVADRTREELAIIEAAQTEEKPAHPANYHSFTGGLMQGEVALFHDVTFGVATDRRTGQGCAWIRQVDIRLTLSPVLYVAKDLQQHDCWHREIYRHELEHVAVDRALMQKYAAQITDGLNMVFTRREDYITGPYEAGDGEDARQAMRDMIAYPLGALFDAMMAERPQAQAAIDSPGEIMRVAGVCEKDKLPSLSLSAAGAAEKAASEQDAAVR